MPCRLCQERGQTWSGDAPKCSFEDPSHFSPEGWNCATANAIRNLFPDEWSGETCLPYSFSRRYDDDSAAAIHLGGCELETGYAKVLYVGWYKDRGRTDEMWLLGDDEPRRPSLADCEQIIAHFGTHDEHHDEHSPEA